MPDALLALILVLGGLIGWAAFMIWFAPFYRRDR